MPWLLSGTKTAAFEIYHSLARCKGTDHRGSPGNGSKIEGREECKTGGLQHEEAWDAGTRSPEEEEWETVRPRAGRNVICYHANFQAHDSALNVAASTGESLFAALSWTVYLFTCSPTPVFPTPTWLLHVGSVKKLTQTRFEVLCDEHFLKSKPYQGRDL